MYSCTIGCAEMLHGYFLATNAFCISPTCLYIIIEIMYNNFIFLCDSDMKNDRFRRILKGPNTRCSVEAILVSYWRI